MPSPAHVAIAAVLIVIGYAGAGAGRSVGAQNQLVVGLILLMLAILSAEITQPPSPWRNEQI